MTLPLVGQLRGLSPHQWKSGLAAWLGWLFDGLDIHLFTLVAVPLVAELLQVAPTHPDVGHHGSLIQASFMLGWALGGAVFGRLGDLLGRTRALSLTILFYAGFTGLSFFATAWWHLLILRFLAALGIGGEWAVGASLLAETWPKTWRPWIAATLQTAVNLGILFACLFGWLLQSHPPRTIFLVGVLPAFLVLWIRRSVPEPEEWHTTRSAGSPTPGILDLFRGSLARTTWIALLLCGISLTAHWTFMFWQQAHVRTLPEISLLDPAGKNRAVATALFLIIFSSIMGNYVAAALAKLMGYAKTIALMLLAYGILMLWTYHAQPSWTELRWALMAIGLCQGVFGLFTMCLPPLFPVLLRTTGAGFCYNFGRILSAVGVVVFGLMTTVGDFRAALFHSAFLFIPAALIALFLPEPIENDSTPRPSPVD